MIEIKHLDIQFKQQVIFKNANFKTCPGKITGIIGKSGCGKTTFLKALIYQYKNQILSIDKQVITEKNKEDYLLHCVSYIDQFGTFFENMKIIEHFEFISQLKKQNFNQNKMLETLYLVGLDAIDLKNYPSSLSIGQRKRFLIALAMFKDASIIIIDEPTASLDQENKEIILNLLQKLKKDNKYIIITTHDDFLIEHLDIIYEIENKQLCCHQEIKEVQQVLKIEKTKHQRIKKYFFYKNQRQWFQFLLVMLLGFMMTVSISINISDSILQENQLANGIERANKAEVYTGKMNDAFFGNDGYFIGDQINNLDISDDELAQMKAIKHVKGVYPFDVFDTINQMQNVSTTSVYFQGNKVNFDYLQDGSPLVAPYYSFQNIKVNGKKLYEYARNGEEVEIKERDIEIMMIELIDFSNNEIVFDVKCSKGTYIRSLCVDIAKKLGYPGHMSHLERRQAGRFLITDCITLEQLENDDYSLHSIDDALCGFPQLKLDDPTPVYHGKQIKSDLTGQVAIYDNQNRLLAIYESTGQGYLKNVRGLW